MIFSSLQVILLSCFLNELSGFVVGHGSRDMEPGSSLRQWCYDTNWEVWNMTNIDMHNWRGSGFLRLKVPEANA